MGKISASFLTSAAAAMFNKSEWRPVGEAYNLKDIWDATNPGLYEEIQGDEAEIVMVTFDDGSDALRIEVPFKDGTSVQLKLGKGEYEEGDKVKISTITGQELRKVGSDPIVRYQAEVI